MDWTPGESTGTVSVSSLTPGDYEFQIVFYVDSRTSGNTLYVGHWIPFRIQPGRTTSVDWHPEVGALTVDIRIKRPPPRPTDLTATWTEEELHLEWSASGAANNTHYNV